MNINHPRILPEAGVAVVAAAIDDVDGSTNPVGAELRAALVFVQRRRLRDKDPQKALAALARQGFAYDVCRRALQTPDE